MMRYFSLKAHTGKYVTIAHDGIGTLVATADQPDLTTIFEFIAIPDGHPDTYMLRPACSEFYVTCPTARKVCANGWLNQATQLRVEWRDGQKAGLHHGWCLCVEEDGTVVFDRTQIGAWETFELQAGDERMAQWNSQTNCCGTAHADHGEPSHHPGLLRWNEGAHRGLVQHVMDLLQRLDGIAQVSRLLSLWRVDVFQQRLLDGLRDADDKSPYRDTVYSSHFYDPDTGGSWLPAFIDRRNAYTECKAYAFQSFSLLSSLDWSAKADPQRLGEAGYLLGLALHYFTDLTQPMHAANFANILGARWDINPFDWRHSEFETLAEGLYASYMIDPQALAVEEVLALTRDNLDAVIIDTARYAKSIFTQHIKPLCDTKLLSEAWTVEEVRPALQPAFTYAQKATAAFLATWVRLNDFQSTLYTQPDTGSAHAPSFVEWNDQAYMFWGHSDDHLKYQIYYARFDPDTATFSDVRYVFNSDPAVDNLYQTYETPAVAVLDQVLYVVWHRRATNEIYFSYWRGGDEVGKQWSPARKVTNSACIKDYTAPVVVAYKKRLVAIWADKGSNAPGDGDRDGLWYSIYNPATDHWSEMQKIPGVDSRQTPAATVVGNRIVAAWTGYHDGEPLFMASFHMDTGWTGQSRLPENVGSSEAPCLALVNSTLYLFWRNDSDRQIGLIKSTDGNSWYGRATIAADSHRGIGAAGFKNRLLVGWNQDWRVRYLVGELKA